MARERLTKRQAADSTIPWVGNLNNPERMDPDYEQYVNGDPSSWGEDQDQSNLWKNRERNEIGLGIPLGSEEQGAEGDGSQVQASDENMPKIAATKVAALKAAKLATLLLGDKVSDAVIEAQAQDFMTINASVMDRTLERYSKTASLYAATKEASAALAQEMSGVPPALVTPADPRVADAPAQVVQASEKKVEVKKANAPVVPVSVPAAAPTTTNDNAADEALAQSFQLTANDSNEPAILGDEESKKLASLYDDEVVIPEPLSKKAAVKNGKVQKLPGGQPKVATDITASETNLNDLWKDAPDLSNLL